MSFKVLTSLYTIYGAYDRNRTTFPIAAPVRLSNYLDVILVPANATASFSMFANLTDAFDLTNRLLTNNVLVVEYFNIQPTYVFLKNILIKFNINKNCELLMVGGGSGSTDTNSLITGGGAGGGVLYRTTTLFSSGNTYNFVIGKGGTGAQSGFNTYIDMNDTRIFTALGGSVGTSVINTTLSIYTIVSGNTTSDINGIVTTYTGKNGLLRYPIQNFDIYYYNPGGAGAAGSAGLAGSDDLSDNIHGGNGYTSTITGSSIVYGSGANGYIRGVDIKGNDNILTIGNNTGGFFGAGATSYFTESRDGISGCIIIKIL